MRLAPRSSSLAPRLRDRLTRTLQPGWLRSVTVRRVIAALLVLAALGWTIAHRESTDHQSVIVTARDVMPGHRLSAADLRLVSWPRHLVPAGALTSHADAESQTVTGPVRAGEVVTDSRVLSPRLPARLTGLPDARLVPIQLADESIAAILRAGDVVDVLTAQSRVLARNAVVALVPTPPATTRPAGSPPILLAMGEDAAHHVAGAGLDVGLAVVVH